MLINTATEADIAEILALQKLAYQSEALLYNDYTIQPLVQDEFSLLEEFKNGTILKATIDQQIIGSVRATIGGDTCYLGKLIVSPEHQNKGIGKQLMKAIEEIYGKVAHYELFTGDQSVKNIALYELLGYEIFNHKIINERLTMIFMRKMNTEV